jgi:hypothetical protein
MVSNIHQRATWTGTDAERTALTPDVAGSTFYCTDTDLAYWWDGAAWIAMGGSGSIIKEVVFTKEGTLTVAPGATRVYNTMGISFNVTKVLICVNTAPDGSAIIVDVNKNGVTIFTNQAHRPQIASGAYVGETVDIDIPAWVDDDYFTVDIDAIGADTAGDDLTVHIAIEQS